MMSREISKISPFLSARTRPSTLKKDVEDMYLHSEPASPVAYDLELQESEFAISRQFDVKDSYYTTESWSYEDATVVQENKKHSSHAAPLKPGTEFADEQFADGKLKPLEPPPGLYCVTTRKKDNEQCHGKLGSYSNSPRSPSARIKAKFLQWRSMLLDDSDPFEVALEKVRKETEWKGGIDHASGKETVESSDTTRKGTKRQKIKTHLSKYSLMMKKTWGHENTELPKPKIQTKLSLMSVTLFQGRPKLPLCIGYGPYGTDHAA